MLHHPDVVIKVLKAEEARNVVYLLCSAVPFVNRQRENSQGIPFVCKSINVNRCELLAERLRQIVYSWSEPALSQSFSSKFRLVCSLNIPIVENDSAESCKSENHTTHRGTPMCTIFFSIILQQLRIYINHRLPEEGIPFRIKCSVVCTATVLRRSVTEADKDIIRSVESSRP